MSNAAISQERWQTAQAHESAFWSGSGVGLLLNSAGGFSTVIETLGPDRCAAMFDGKDVLDVGSGPWAVNIALCYPHLERIKRWAVAEPLPRLDVRSAALGDGAWAGGFIAWLAQRLARLEYIQVSGEALDLDKAFDTITCVNVLDHVREPGKILRNIHRALRPGGRFLLSVDCLSLAGRLKFEWLRRSRPDDFIIAAHPFSFRVEHVARLLADTGFRVDTILGGPSRLSALIGRAHRPLFLCSAR